MAPQILSISRVAINNNLHENGKAEKLLLFSLLSLSYSVE
jgi:hypothetical protein